jgi:hypothetical protein
MSVSPRYSHPFRFSDWSFVSTHFHFVKVKVKLSLCFFYNWAGVKHSSTHSLTSALDGGEWSASPQGKSLWYPGSWVDPRAFLDAVVKRKIPGLGRESNSRTPIVYPARSLVWRQIQRYPRHKPSRVRSRINWQVKTAIFSQFRVVIIGQKRQNYREGWGGRSVNGRRRTAAVKPSALITISRWVITIKCHCHVHLFSPWHGVKSGHNSTIRNFCNH